MTGEGGRQRHWTEFDWRSSEIYDLDLSQRIDILAPRNEKGKRCPWPWEPQMLSVTPREWINCRYCGALVQEGVEHPDYGKTGSITEWT